ncbi:hypothetical protein [Sinorhizobium americanum]|uniref:Uncharacterized protein n=1 Tax=Sinorhizobium americanum TaxID=194963 RepID=A0A1L3LZ94_9HYPH|nr:hypothetical protein [Sinorhizobium americanum]APG95391.1 hypothetical protein SAMCFNEI73_pC1687 [Sinorhizobium americanum]OAP39521.1 hypothetical protein ATC00_09760 [Sinorhizobium americanum]
MLKKLKKLILSNVKAMLGVKPKKKQQSLTAPDIQIYRQLVNFAFNFPVNTIKYNGEHIWPYIRHHLLVQLTAVSIGNKKARDINPFRLQLGNPGEFDIDRKRELAAKYGFNFLEDLSDVEPVDFLFFTALNASEQIEVEQKIYYRVSDPLYEMACRAGKAHKVELIRNNSPAIRKTPRYLHRPTFIFSPHIVRTGYNQCIQIKESIRTYFERYLPALRYDGEALLKLVEWELHTRDFCLDLLRTLKPKAIFVPSFHYYAPMISAARELGIVSVDIQHGIQVGYNPLYNDWSELPAEGYRCLPDYFFVWSEKERQNIDNVFGPHSSPKIIGNLWLKKQLSLDVQFSSALEEAFARHKKIVLLAMQSQTVVPDLFKKLIADAGQDFLWLIRMHPKGKKYKLTDFSKTARNVIVSEEVDKLPLVPLLDRVDITLSEGSTIAVEGDTIGVAAFISSETGRLNYINEIKDGQFHYIDSVQSFLRAAGSLGNDRRSRAKELVDIDVLSILKQIIGNPRAASDKELHLAAANGEIL